MISVELPGHGSSSWSAAPATDYAIPGYARLLVELIPKLTNDKYILLGYSLGGNAAIEALPALQNCIGLMAVNTAITSKPAQLEAAFHPSPVLQTIFKEDADEEELVNYAHAFFSATNENLPNSLFTDFKDSDPKTRAVLAQSIQEGNHEDEVAILKNTTVPVALVTGKEDRLGNKEFLKNLDVPKWNDTTIEVPDAGHMPQLENSEFFDDSLLRFIAHCKAQSEARERS